MIVRDVTSVANDSQCIRLGFPTHAVGVVLLEGNGWGLDDSGLVTVLVAHENALFLMIFGVGRRC